MDFSALGSNRAKIKEIYDDGFMEINGTEYKFLKFKHRDRLKVLTYAQRLADKSTYIGDEERWPKIEELLCKRLSVNDVILSKEEDYWEDHPEDFLTVIKYAIGVIIYPFIKGKNIASVSQKAEKSQA